MTKHTHIEPVERRSASAKASLLVDCRGSATTEAVAMLPFFVLVYSLIIFVMQSYESRIEATSAARQTGWSYSMASCGGDAPTTAEISGGSNLAKDDFLSGDASTTLEEIGNFVPFVVPILDRIVGRNITAASSMTVAKPATIGGGDNSVTGAFAITCNEKKWDLADEVGSTFCNLTGAWWCPAAEGAPP
jgi:hypothetical protein